MQKLCSSGCGLRANPLEEGRYDPATPIFGSDVKPCRLGTEHAPEHVVEQRPLNHADNLAAALCDQQVSHGTVAEVRATQCQRRSRMTLGWMTFDEVGNHTLDRRDVLLIGIADQEHVPAPVRHWHMLPASSLRHTHLKPLIWLLPVMWCAPPFL